MNIEIKITHTLAPEVLDLVKRFLGSDESPKPETPVKSIAPKKAAAVKAEAPAPAPKEDMPAPKQDVPARPGNPALTLEEVRAVAVPLSKSGHKDAIKAKINELAGKETALPSLDAVHYPALMEFLNTLK